MTTSISEILLAATLLLNVCLVSSSRLLHCIRLCACQGVILGLLQLCNERLAVGTIAMALIAIAVKGVILPLLLARTMRRCAIKRELEPLVPYGVSILTIFIVSIVAFSLCKYCGLTPDDGEMLALPTAFITIFAGLFMVVSRRKAIVQAIGFLFFENGIGLFGAVMHLENGFVTELGILLDVLALIFIMGIAIFDIRQAFTHIDADRLNLLDDQFHPRNK